MAIENFEAIISANIRDFQQELREVDAIIRETALGAEAMIGANTQEFMSEAAAVQTTIQDISTGDNDVEIGADIGEFMAEAAAVTVTVESLTTGENNVEIDADISGFMQGAALVQARARALRDRIRVRITSSWSNYQQAMGQIASFSRNIGEVAGIMGRGGMMVLSPAAVPVIASAVGLIGNLGPMLGVLGGATFGLGTAFGAAGIGAIGFAAVAIPAISSIIERSKEAAELQEKIANASTAKEANKYIKQMDAIYKGMSKNQLAAMKGLREFKKFYADFAASLREPMLEVFINGMKSIQNVMKMARPMIENVTKSVAGLLDSFNQNLKSADVKDFFTFLSNQAAPALEAISKSAGNFMMGFFNMMEAFGPMSVNMQNGFLGMSESFRNWAANLDKSEKFQAFVDYVTTNMPKIRSIFGDAIMGMVNMFTGFGTSSSEMMTGLQNLMSRFRNFSSTISQNKGFQNFLDYFKTNGPVVVSAIGELITLIVNFGIALAPMGQKILGMVDSFMNWSNGMMQAHPWLGKLAAGALLVVGGLTALAPAVLLTNALFGGLIITMIKTVAKMTWAAVTMVAKWLWMATQATVHAIRVGAAWAWTTGVQMVTALAKMTVSAALFVAKWLWMGVQAGLHALKVAAAWTLTTGVAMATAIASMAVAAAQFIAKWALIATQSLLHAARVAGAWLLTTGVAMATAVASMVATSAVFVAKWVWMGVQSLLAAARMAAAWFIALGPIGWVAGAIVGLVALVILNWDKISAWTSKAWSATASFVTNAVSQIAGFIQQKFPTLYNVIASYMNMTKNIISTVWNGIKATFSNVLSFLTALVKGDFQGMKAAIQSQMNLAKSVIQQIWGAIKSYLSTLLGSLVSTFGSMFSKIVSTIRSKTAEAVSALRSKVGEMPGVVTSFVGAMLSAGGQLVSGLINGIKNMGGAAIEAISGVVGGVISKAKSLLDINSPSRVFYQIGDFVGQGLAKGVTGTAKQVAAAGATLASKLTNAMRDKKTTKMQRAALQSTKVYAAKQIAVLQSIAKQRETVATKIKAASQKLNDAIKVRGDFAKSVADNAKAFASVGNIDAKTGFDFVTQLKDRLAAIKKFQADIKRLQKAGLNDSTLQDLINAGVDGGGQKAAILAGSSTSIIKELNATQSAINKASSSLGKDAANQFYGLGVDAARGIVQGLESQAKALEVSANKISNTLVNAVKKKLKIHSPSRVFAEMGGFVSEGLAVGISDKAKSAIHSVKALTAGMTGAFNPQMEFANMNASASLNTNVSRSDMGVVRHAFAAEMDSVEVNQPDLVLVVDGKELGKVVARPVKEENERYDKMVSITKRGR